MMLCSFSRLPTRPGRKAPLAYASLFLFMLVAWSAILIGKVGEHLGWESGCAISVGVPHITRLYNMGVLAVCVLPTLMKYLDFLVGLSNRGGPTYQIM